MSQNGNASNSESSLDQEIEESAHQYFAFAILVEVEMNSSSLLQSKPSVNSKLPSDDEFPSELSNTEPPSNSVSLPNDKLP